jgi:tetratricopeptide (TPR) repeat protein
VQNLDKTFFPETVNLRIAEVSYRLNNIPEALEALNACEGFSEPQIRFKVSFLRGKCLERLKNYSAALEQFQIAKNLCPDTRGWVLGHIYFRLGWAQICSR